MNSVHLIDAQEITVNERYIYIMMLLFYSHTILTYVGTRVIIDSSHEPVALFSSIFVSITSLLLGLKQMPPRSAFALSSESLQIKSLTSSFDKKNLLVDVKLNASNFNL